MHYQRVCEVLSESIQATLFKHHTQKILRRFHTHYLIFANILSCSKIFFKNKHPSFMIKMKPRSNVFPSKNTTWCFTMVSVELLIFFKLSKAKESFACNLKTQNYLHKEDFH